MNYQIVQQVAGKEFIPAMKAKSNAPMLYDCPKKAKMVADRLTTLKGIKFQIRPVAANDWRNREQQRFDNGTYKPVVWAGQEWWEKNKKADHYTHVSIKDPTKIAFIKDDKCGAADIQTAMKPGKYLVEHFGAVLSTEQIRKYAMDHALKFEERELLFASAVEDIQRVYAAPLRDSCFSETTKANLYGSGDFAVAYIEDNGAIKARALTCPERMIYCRPYGDTRRLSELLKTFGFRLTNYYEDWKGLKLLTKWYWRGFYTDFGGRPRPEAGKENEEFFFV